MPQFFDEQASGSQYGTGSVASTCSTRDYKDATDLVVQPVCVTGNRTHTLTRRMDGSEDGTGRGTPIVPTIAFHPTQDPISSVEVTHALGTGSKGGCATAAVATVTEPYTLAIRGRENGASLEYRQDGTANAILTPSGGRAGIGVGAIAFTVGNLVRGAGAAPSTETVGTLTAQHGRGSSDQQPVVAFVQNTRDEVRLGGGDGQTVGALAAQPGMKQTTYLATIEVTGTLSSRATAGGGLGTDFEVAGGLQAVDVYNGTITGQVTATLNASTGASANHSGPQVPAALPTMAVRRLLPVECERLQGFPDDHTNIPWRGKPAPDGPRYKAMGNSMAVPVMRWIGQRLDRVAKGDR